MNLEKMMISISEIKKQLSEVVNDKLTKIIMKNNSPVSVIMPYDEYVKLKNDKISSMITLSEESRRMADMMKMYNMYGMDPGMFGESQTLVLNVNNQLVKYILDNKEVQDVDMFCNQLYDLALISNKPLEPEAMTKFIERSNEILIKLANI